LLIRSKSIFYQGWDIHSQ